MRVLATLASMVRGVPHYVVALLLAVFLISGTAWAQRERMVLVLAPGQLSCGAWSEAKENGEDTLKRQLFLTWVNGYLTAYSRWGDEGFGVVSSLPDAIGAHSWIDLYCQTDPTEAVADVVQRLIFWLEAH